MSFLRTSSVLLLLIAIAGAAQTLAVDCNTNGLEDACDLDCGVAAGPCDLPGCGASADCDGNGVPDECDLAVGGSGCHFTTTLLDNSTGAVDSIFVGAPDDTFFGLGGQVVTYSFDCALLADGPGSDFTIYEVDFGGAEFSSIDVLVSADGLAFISVKASEAPAVNVPGDAVHGDNKFARSYDLSGSGLPTARFIRLDGNGTGAAGSTTGFDLDAVGLIHQVALDCDGSGTLDACEALADCNANGVPDSCGTSLGLVLDCNGNSTPDSCDAGTTSLDCNANDVPDECETDCNTNGTPDDCDIASLAEEDCNVNGIPDVCEVATPVVSIQSERFSPLGSGSSHSLVILSAFPATGDVTLTLTAVGDLSSSNEYVSIDLNGTALGRLFESGGGACSETVAALVVDADTFNFTVGGGDATFTLSVPTSVSAFECRGYVELNVSYATDIDCNTNGAIDYCDIAGGGSNDVNSNGIADECEVDCNGNTIPDDFDISSGTSPDCNLNEVPDECDLDGGTSLDCNTDDIPDECQTDCNTNGTPDDCDISGGTSFDCDSNLVPDECDLATLADGCSFTNVLADNGTSEEDFRFTGPPDDIYWGLGGQVVTFDFDCAVIVDGAGPDFTIYEVDFGSAEFQLIDVLVSEDGLSFFSVRTSESAALNIPGDETHGSNGFARSYDLGPSGLKTARFIRLDGNGTGASGTSTGFDLDAVGLLNKLGVDCDSNGTLDACEPFTDCNTNSLPDSCELSIGPATDCNGNNVPDECDTFSGSSLDCNTNDVPDECELDCNLNTIPDQCDIGTTSTDCNGNTVPDECDLATTTILIETGHLMPAGALQFQALSMLAPFPAAGDVTVSVTAATDLGASNEYLDVDLDGIPIGRLFDVGGLQCGEVSQQIVISAETFNLHAVTGAVAFNVVAATTVNGSECLGSYLEISVSYDPIIDCNINAQIDACEGGQDLNVNGILDECEPDCNTNGTPDDYDIAQGTSLDCNADGSPDECDLSAGTSLDCNLNSIPDECDIDTGFSVDCNDNIVPDNCDLDQGQSLDCDNNNVPDECPQCPTVEVVFIMDKSSSMSDEASALCSTITQVVSTLQAVLVNVDTELLAIPSPGTGSFSCLTESVVDLYGTTVPGNPPPGNETLGDCPGGNQVASEDWGRATSVVAGVKAWQADSVRLVVAISDEGPWCGNPVTDPGVDRDSITHAIGVAVANDVIVSTIAGTGSGASLIAMQQDLSSATGGQHFSSSLPADDLAEGIKALIIQACDAVSDCNANDIPDTCELDAGTSDDCNFNNIPDECEADCNGNGVEDSCDIAADPSLDGDGDGILDVCAIITLTFTASDVTWTSVPGGIGYDVIQGDLALLGDSAGDFTLATEECLGNDLVVTSLAHTGLDPGAPGEGLWFVVRGILGTGNLSYDSFAASQVGGRDTEIDGSTFACP